MLKSALPEVPAAATLDWFYQLIKDPCESAEMDADVQKMVRAHQVRIISRMTPVVLTGKIGCALALGLILLQVGQITPLATVWVLFSIAVSSNALVNWWQREARPDPTAVSRRRTDRIVFRTVVFALIWSIPGALLVPQLTGSAQSFVIVMCAGMVAGGAISLYAVPAAAILYCSIVSVCTLVGIAISGIDPVISYFIVTVAFLFVATTSILRYAEIFVSEFIGRIELDRKNAEIQTLLTQAETVAMAERRRSEMRLAQAQKMEAIGQLTGGIAHDFNNLLAAIQGNTELIELEGKSDPSLIDPILQSTRRGSALVHRLLSFASKQILKPQRLDVGHLIENMQSLLHRTVSADVRIKTEFASDLWDVHADAGQLETSLVNLVLNAQEALGKEGLVQIICENVTAENSPELRDLSIRAGSFVCIRVRDNGKGMSARTRERAVDPFFTTKTVGQGSGLGLSTVYGFVRQSGGHLCIDSKLGTGTTITLLLPRLVETGVAPPAPRRTKTTPVGDGQHILVVEDDPAVRQMVGDMLTSLNFRVAFASTAEIAMSLVQSTELDLVLTDVILPGDTSGPQLAERLSKDHAELPVLFMSGFTSRNCVFGNVEPTKLLEKPFNRRGLAEFVHQGLAAGAHRSTSQT